MRELIINYTPTGMIPVKEMTPHVPVSPTEIIEDVHAAWEAGVTLAHLHARHPDGRPAYERRIYAQIFEGVRRHCPDLVICASLSGRTFPAFEQRSEVLELEPDMASLTLGSMNFAQEPSMNSPDMIAKLVEKMKHHGVHPELECFDGGMINYAKFLIGKSVLKPPFYFNILVGNVATAQDDLQQVGLLINQLPDGAIWSLAGIGKSQLRANTLAMLEGGGVRVGLEDNLWFDAGRTRLATNLELLRRIHELAAVFERPVMKPAEFGRLGFYNQKRSPQA
ncbi:3-keto-5-aminohexanoate cleavage protein [Prosthecobacter sp.]|uniref:3-keto-5-aminohexanoate cleavage protein n=1 Tax=Prosthecobacter sp. TaxID=1965333 RepID=UPI001D97307C|nr:3-keto-5-aminohexanoate cleavage protein [Prosthecobacter sp.]MCB1278755.1 3-keto-5-aminohexanoate cleavage protein [Prosthecobacter sp.]